jgi:Ca-activated chloride channel family protein
LWATRRVGWLLEQIRTNGEQQELKDEVTDLGTRYGIVTPYTSYLALEPGAGNQFMVEGEAGRPPARPMPIMRRDSAAKAARPSAAPADSNMGYLAGTGAAAVQRSKRERVLQESVRSEDEKDAIGSNKRVGGKTFYLVDGVWTDSEVTANSKLPETVVVFGTDEYFALLKQKPALGQFFSIAEKVVVIFEGRIYRVKAASSNTPNN